LGAITIRWTGGAYAASWLAPPSKRLPREAGKAHDLRLVYKLDVPRAREITGIVEKSENSKMLLKKRNAAFIKDGGALALTRLGQMH